jgi:ZIP family zinc transporter
MPIVIQIVLLTAIAGLAMPAGAMLATIERIQPAWLEQELRHSVIAFGGGILLSAVALVLVPDGVEALSMPWVVGLFALGGIAFLLLDRALEASGNSASQLVAMLSDFLPEAMALGATFAVDRNTGMLLALLITFQNLPEGFNAYRELVSSGSRGRWIIIAMCCLVPLGPAMGLAGHYWLAPHPEGIGGVMLFAASGILYLTFQDIAPQAKLSNRHAPALGAVAGFLVGVIGHMLLS